MSLLPSPVDYTDKDFDSLRLRLQNLVKSTFPTWTDFDVANFGNMLIELFAFLGDNVLYYADANARESRIGTATQRRNVLALVKILNYSPTSATAATADVTVALAATPVGSFTLPAGTIIKTEEVTDPIVFQLLADALIAAGDVTPTVTVSVENSEAREDRFVSDGKADQEVLLASKPYLDDSAVVVAGNGAYTQVSNFLDSTSTDRHYTTTVDQNDQAKLRFGNGTNGALPSGTIVIDYKTGGGAEGNVEAAKITKLEGAFTDSLGNPVTVTVTNPTTAAGGADRQTTKQIQQRAPESLRVLGRNVAREDFEITAKQLATVDRALMLTINEDSGISENSGSLSVIPAGGGVPSAALKDAVLTQVTETFKSTLTFAVTVVDPSYKVINVQAGVALASSAVAATVKAAIEANLATFFALNDADGLENTNVDFGHNKKDAAGDAEPLVAWSDIFNVVRDTVGVRNVDPVNFLLNSLREDVTLTAAEFPTLGTITLIDRDTGLAL